MKNIWRIFLSITSVCVLSSCQSFARDPLFRLTLRVVDDEGTPVAGANARIGAERRPKAGESGGKGVFAEGLTDENGIFTGEVEAWDATRAGYSAEKVGHYPVRQRSYSSKPPVRGKWQPWNPTLEVVLKRIRNPVPMYARRVSGDIPASETDVGFDLAAGDWVTPYGRGKVVDMIFHSAGEVRNDRDYSGRLTVTFPGEGNGLLALEIPKSQASPLRMPYEASEGGYQQEMTWRSMRKYNPQTRRNDEYVDDSSETRNFFIRVRTETDAAGNVVRAWYGKINAPFVFDARGTDPWGRTKRQYISFTYYLNPDGTRNVEFDPKRNLLKSPKPFDPNYENLAP